MYSPASPLIKNHYKQKLLIVLSIKIFVCFTFNNKSHAVPIRFIFSEARQFTMKTFHRFDHTIHKSEKQFITTRKSSKASIFSANFCTAFATVNEVTKQKYKMAGQINDPSKPRETARSTRTHNGYLRKSQNNLSIPTGLC